MDKSRFESQPVRAKHESFLRTFVDDLMDLAVFDATERTSRVLDWRSPDDLQQALDLELKSSADDDERLLQLSRDIIRYSVKTGHPYFVNQLFSGVDPYALAGQWLTDALNPSLYTYEVAPVFTLMEETVLAEMRRIVGFRGLDDGRGDGIFCPGGSLANGYAISCARFRALPEVKSKGFSGVQRLVLFTSEDAHYSVKKLAAYMGVGSDNVYTIKTDAVGRLLPEHLQTEIERALNEGALPFMVSATAGTTVLGAFDPLEKIAHICEQYKIWLHVDAAWGGGALMSRKYRHLLSGIERADSVTWNPHKMLAAPQQCSTFLTRHEGLLSECHSANASYLFQKDKCYDTKYDTGDKHIQCGRRADVLKFWFMWRAKGSDGFEQHVDRVFANAEYFTTLLAKRDDFHLIIAKPQCTNVSFWYVPPSLAGIDRQSDQFIRRIESVAPTIKARMMAKGSLMMTYQPLREIPNFFRFVLQNSSLTFEDMDYIVNEIVRLGSDL